MTFLQQIFAACILIFSCFSHVYAVDHATHSYRNFWMPTYHGIRLNYCMVDGKYCGLAVATRYCQMMGYLRADQQVIDYNVGFTHFISTPMTCKGWRCNGFKTIRCVAKITHKPPKTYHYRLRQYVYPRFNHFRVAWCYDGTHDCGKRAAFSFCRRMGYLQTRQFAIEKDVPATKAIGNQRLCIGHQCHAFKYITCFR